MYVYNQQFNDKVTEFIAAVRKAVKTGAGELVDRDFRKQKVNAMIEEYFAATGGMPEAKQVERLTDALLCEELTDSTPYKIANTEYPFMNERMFEERAAKNAASTAADHEQERKMTGSRRQRSPYENALSDRKAKARNKERRRRYNDFISGKTPGVMTVKIAKEAE